MKARNSSNMSAQKVRVVQQRLVEVASIQFKISTNVPLPPKKSRGPGKYTCLYRAMANGECVEMPSANAANSIRQAAYKDGGRVSQRMTDNGVIRCWRIE